METGLFIACAALTAACALIAVYFMKAFREKTYDRAAILKTACCSRSALSAPRSMTASL